MRQVLVNVLPGVMMDPSGMVTSFTNAAASQRLTGADDWRGVDDAIDKVDVGVAVGKSTGSDVEVKKPLPGVLALWLAIASIVCAAAV
jgi:hypothetical protein